MAENEYEDEFEKRPEKSDVFSGHYSSQAPKHKRRRMNTTND